MLEISIFKLFCPISALLDHFYVLQLLILDLTMLVDKFYNDAIARELLGVVDGGVSGGGNRKNCGFWSFLAKLDLKVYKSTFDYNYWTTLRFNFIAT